MKIIEFKDRIFDNPDLFNSVRSTLLFGKGKMYKKIKEAIEQRGEEKVLDVCCGTGEFSQLFNSNYVGVDMCDSFLELARKKYKKKFLKKDAMNLDFKNKEFDKTVFISAMHHFTEQELGRIYPELARITKKRIVILDPVPQKYNPIGWLLYSLDRGANMRTAKEQKCIVKKYFNIEKFEVFQSFLYKLSVISCKPKR